MEIREGKNRKRERGRDEETHTHGCKGVTYFPVKISVQPFFRNLSAGKLLNDNYFPSGDNLLAFLNGFVDFSPVRNYFRNSFVGSNCSFA